MKILYNKKFKENIHKFPESTQKKFKKQIGYLVDDIRHPSLHAKKYNEVLNIWQARVDKNIRFYFSVEEDTYILLDIKNHPK